MHDVALHGLTVAEEALRRFVARVTCLTSKRETAELRRPPLGCTCDAGPRLQPHCCSRSNTLRAAQAHPAGARETVRAKGRARTLAEGVSRSTLAPAQAGLMGVYAA